MRTARRGLLFFALFLMTAMLFTAAVSAIGMPGGREGAAAGMPDPLTGSDMPGDTEGNLGDTEPGADSWLGEADGIIDGTAGEPGTGTQSDTLLPGDGSAPDSATDTAGTSSGNGEEGGMSVWGIVITIVIILAVAALIIALIPKKRSM